MGASVPGGLVCKCEPTSKWESSRDNSCQRGGKFTRVANVYSPWLQRVCGAGETPLKCKPAHLPRRAGHGQARPRGGAFKDTDGADNCAVLPTPFSAAGSRFRRYPKPGTRDKVGPAPPSGTSPRGSRGDRTPWEKRRGAAIKKSLSPGLSPHPRGPQPGCGVSSASGPLSLNLAPSV